MAVAYVEKRQTNQGTEVLEKDNAKILPKNRTPRRTVQCLAFLDAFFRCKYRSHFSLVRVTFRQPTVGSIMLRTRQAQWDDISKPT